MRKIHPASQITTVPELDLFTVPPTQLSIERTVSAEYRPLSSLSSNSVIEFNINSNLNEYINLRDTVFFLRIRINISKTGGAAITATEWDTVQPVNNLLHSIFRTVDFEIEGKSVTQSPQTYAYKSFFETWMGYVGEAKIGLLTSQLFYEDEPYKKAISVGQSDFITPNPIDATGKGKIIDLAGKLHVDLFMQPKSLIGGLKCKLTLVPNDPSFYIWSSDPAIVATVDFDMAALFVSKSIVSYPVVEAHNLKIAETPIKYPIRRGVVKTFTVSAGSLDVNIDNALTGQKPRRCFLTAVDSRGVNGVINYNPYYFENSDVKYCVASLNGVYYPSVPYTPNFSKDLFMREFIGLYETLNQMTTDVILNLSRDEFKDGNCVYGFTFASDPIDDCNKVGYVNPITEGDISFNLKFENALTKNINIIIYAEYDNIITLDGTRTPYCDYI